VRVPGGRKTFRWVFPIEWGLLAALAGGLAILDVAAEDRAGLTAVGPWTGRSGITETVDQIMARETRMSPLGLSQARERKRPYRMELPRAENPSAPDVSRWPPPDGPAPPASTIVEPLNPQPVGANFKGISLLAPNESQWLPPDSMGDASPTQILVAANGRIKVFSKTGVLGGLNADLDVFFSSVLGGSETSDPQVRYDRLSGRWFVTAITVNAPNRIVIAVSSGSTITGDSSFTFFFFQHDLVNPPGDTGLFADYDNLGVDRFALYIGTNTFNAAGTIRTGAAGFVVNKADLLGGTLTVIAFRGLNTAGSSNGPYSPRGVGNDDPSATEGYFIGVDNAFFSRLVIRRVSDPGGTPTISGNINLTVPTTTFPIRVPHLGMAMPNRRLDALDDRLFAARIHTNKITGVTSLWTAQNIQVNSSGVASSTGGRDGARWYEIRSLTTTPALFQSGTLFDPAGSNPRFFWIPTVAMSGQGHMALGSSTAGSNFRADVAVAGRLADDALGTIQPFTQATFSSTAYNQQAVDGQRWGDYSLTVVDPADDMTLWTFQEYCDATNSWGVQVVQLVAPSPATPAGAAPSAVCQGTASTSVVIAGTSVSGSGFFDPGPDTGGPGFAGRLSASVTGGVTVNGVTFTSPTQVTLDVSAVAATAGAKDVTITNPDGQSGTGVGILTVSSQPTAPAAFDNGPICAGATLALTASTVAGAAYSWTGPNGFTSSQQSPSIPDATPAASGTYSVTVRVGGCASLPATTTAMVVPAAGACDDGDACTMGETCQTGVCSGGGLRDADSDAHADTLCGGDDCNDTNPMVWIPPVEVTNLFLSAASPTDLSWDSQGVLVGPETTYDLVSGPFSTTPGLDLSSGTCLQASGGTGYSDIRPDPSEENGFWYLARARNSCGLGTYGTSQRDSTIPPCP